VDRLPETAMPRIDIRHPHALPTTEARAVVERIAGRMREKFALDGHWEGDAFVFARTGVKGAITVADDESASMPIWVCCSGRSRAPSSRKSAASSRNISARTPEHS